MVVLHRVRIGIGRQLNTVTDGFETVPTAVAGVYSGPRLGKVQVRFAAHRVT